MTLRTVPFKIIPGFKSFISRTSLRRIGFGISSLGSLPGFSSGMTFDNSQEVSVKQTVPAAKNAVNDAKDMSGLEKRIKNKKLLAEELGIGEITLTDILKELEKP